MKNSIEELQANNTRLRAALLDMIRAGVWLFEGPYGHSPEPSDLANAREIFNETPTESLAKVKSSNINEGSK